VLFLIKNYKYIKYIKIYIYTLFFNKKKRKKKKSNGTSSYPSLATTLRFAEEEKKWV
jgi:hypothetical protein